MNSQPTPSADMLRKMLDSLDVSVYTFGPDRKVIFANAVAQEKLSLTASGTPVGAAEKNHFDRHKYYDESGDQLDYPRGSAVEHALQGIATDHLLIEHRDTQERYHEWLQISCQPVMSESGVFEYGILSYRDVTARKHREDQLRFLLESSKILSVTMEFAERFRQKATLAVPTLADWCAIDIITKKGAVKRVTAVHRDSEKIEWLKNFEQKYPPQPGKESAVERIIRTGKAEFIPLVTQEMIDAAPDLTQEQREDIQRLQLSSIMMIPIGLSGNVLGVLTLAFAESNRVFTEDDFVFFQEFSSHLSVLLENARLYEEIKERDHAKDAFLALLSHELRNPLAPIKNAVELLRIKNNDPTLAQEIDVIDHQFDHMTRLLSDLLDSTYFMRGKIMLDLKQVEIADVLRHAMKVIEAVTRKAAIILNVNHPDRPLYVSGDPARLEQALTNILYNAIKFTPRGGEISVSVDHDKENVYIKVKDTGRGITKDEMSRIFEPYYQSERVRSGNSGLGIGLRLVQEIVRLHGGEVTAESLGIDKGSEFQIRLPRAQGVGASPATQQPPQSMEQFSKRVLVVDDNQAVTDGLVRLLNALGWPAYGLYSGKSALLYLENNEADVIFLDIGMPDMDGYELVRELRAKGYDTVPIIALTGYGATEDRQRAFQAGFTSHLTKPVSAKELREILFVVTESG